MSLPDPWVDRIFDKLVLTYGHQFLSRWDGVALEKVKADWAYELRGFAQNVGAIKYGLEHLPAKPPTVVEFRAICNSPNAPARPAPPLSIGHRPKTPQDLATDRHIERIKRLRVEHPEYGMVTWAFALEQKDREEPEWVGYMARSMYREVVANWRARHPSHATTEPAGQPPVEEPKP